MLSRHFVKRGVLSYKHRVVRYVHTKNGSLGLSVADIKRESSPLNKTKIICTMGPACWSVEGITTLIDAGMNVARFNFSHGNHSSHLECLDRLKTALIQRPSAQVAVLLDTKGPEIRTGDVENDGKLVLTKGQTLEVGCDYDRLCTSEYLACSYNSLAATVQPGSDILIADGSLALKVLECRDQSVIAEVLNNCSIGSRKNMNLPGAVVDLPTLTEKDIDDLQNFAVKYAVDFVAASFVRKGSDLDVVRAALGEAGKKIKIISKIENLQGLENFSEILDKSDGIMVARGDLGMEIPLEKVFVAQKYMIGSCNLAGKPVVTATQMFESMITNSRPTRAECSDVAEAVIEGTDAVMLSGETANGEFPSGAVKIMRRTCNEAENIIDYDRVFQNTRSSMLTKGWFTPIESLASSAVKTANETQAKVIVVLTQTGYTARIVSKYRPACPVIAVTQDPAVARQTQGIMSGVESALVPAKVFGSTVGSIIDSAISIYIEKGVVSQGDHVVCISGTLETGSTNNLHVYTV